METAITSFDIFGIWKLVILQCNDANTQNFIYFAMKVEINIHFCKILYRIYVVSSNNTTRIVI